VQIIGTYDTAEGTWTWAWANPLVSPSLAQHAEKLRSYGERHALAELLSRKLTCDEQHCWDFVAADVAMSGAQGAYRGSSDTIMVFMTFGNISTSKSN
jgi:hypothetical protein